MQPIRLLHLFNLIFIEAHLVVCGRILLAGGPVWTSWTDLSLEILVLYSPCLDFQQFYINNQMRREKT